MCNCSKILDRDVFTCTKIASGENLCAEFIRINDLVLTPFVPPFTLTLKDAEYRYQKGDSKVIVEKTTVFKNTPSNNHAFEAI